MVTFNSKNSSYEDIGTFFDVPKGSSLTVNTEGDQIRRVQKMLYERETAETAELSELLVKLDIKEDAKKLEAFMALMAETKGTPKEGLLQRIKASRFLGVLAVSEPLLSVLASAVTIASEIFK